MEKFTLIIHKMVSFLDGKKSSILSLALLIDAFFLNRGIISSDVSSLIQGILAILSGGALAIGTTQAYKDKKLSGKI